MFLTSSVSLPDLLTANAIKSFFVLHPGFPRSLLLEDENSHPLGWCPCLILPPHLPSALPQGDLRQAEGTRARVFKAFSDSS